MKSKRSASFIATCIKHNQSIVYSQTIHQFMNAFADTPLEDCLARMGELLPLEELVVSKGDLQVKDFKKRKKNEGMRSLSEHRCIQQLAGIEKGLNLSEYGLSLVLVHNRFESSKGIDERAEGDQETRVDGEVLLIATEKPEQSVSFVVKGCSYVNFNSIGDACGCYVTEQAMMYLNGTPVWKDFDLEPEWLHLFHYEEGVDQSETGITDEEQRLEEVESIINSAFADVSFGKRNTEALLNWLANFFVPDGRPLAVE